MQSYVRPVDAAHVTAGFDAVRGPAPNQFLALGAHDSKRAGCQESRRTHRTCLRRKRHRRRCRRSPRCTRKAFGLAQPRCGLLLFSFLYSVARVRHRLCPGSPWEQNTITSRLRSDAAYAALWKWASGSVRSPAGLIGIVGRSTGRSPETAVSLNIDLTAPIG